MDEVKSDVKKRGRPVKNPNEKLSNSVCLKLNVEDAVALNKICEAVGMNKQAFFSDCIVKKYYKIMTEDFDVFDYYNYNEEFEDGFDEVYGLEKD